MLSHELRLYACKSDLMPVCILWIFCMHMYYAYEFEYEDAQGMLIHCFRDQLQ